ncbi:hypothetical protein L596_020957 [Steinernema carpocapsae]|uniref:Peptidase S1 domain-containing protein n=1 Tax=Steinernema carpocapsae TaxID=34508 RepID=A0A4U5MVP8_STECR|nr:hypothetical protein L596_020957 [Steinernema carpocapsae]
MRLSLAFLCLWALSSPTASFLIRDGEFELNSNFIQHIEEPSPFPADPDEFLKMVKLAVNFTSKPPELVFGGQRARPGQFPQQAFLSYKSRKGGYYICGASLLSTTHAVTAGHCTHDMISPAKIMVGSTNINDQSANGQWRSITQAYTNPRYNPDDRRIREDIGIVEFSPAITLNTAVQLAKIVADDSQLLQSRNAFISGFGTYTYRGDQTVTSQDLLFAEVQLYQFDYCQSRWRSLDPEKKQICAGSRGKGTGPGDSGGPIQVSSNGQLYQIGLTSFGSAIPQYAQYNQDQYPPVFTRLSSYCQFMNHYSRGTFRCGTVGGGGGGGAPGGPGGPGGPPGGGGGGGGGGGPGGSGCNPPPPPPPDCN